jgi:tetratricopeptide (TPR) repeat protein
MRRAAWVLVVLASATPLRAGVYNLDPPRKFYSDYVETHMPQKLQIVMVHLDELRAIHDLAVNPKDPPKPGSLRVYYEKQLAQVLDKQKSGNLSAADRVNLSACLIRMGRYAKAQEVLEESLRVVQASEPNRVLLLLNLASIYQEDDNLMPRGIQMQREALASWPPLLLAWTRQESEWYRHVEEYTLALMEIRNNEAIRQGGRPPREQPSYDKLFPREERDPAKKIQYVGPGGEYEAGIIAWKEWDRLPTDAEQVILQLLLWRPHDARLLWQYGELLNARGMVDWGYTILNDRVRDNSRWRNRELDRHIQVLREGVKIYKTLFADIADTGDNLRLQAMLLELVAPRGGMAGANATFNEIGFAVSTLYAGALASTVAPPAPPVSTPANSSSMVLPDWRQLAVSFAAGVVVAVLGMLQWRQWRRHRSVHGEPAT